MACEENTSNLIQLLLTMECLALFSPTLSESTVEGGYWAMLDMYDVGAMGALGPASLLFSTLSFRVDYSKIVIFQAGEQICGLSSSN